MIARRYSAEVESIEAELGSIDARFRAAGREGAFAAEAVADLAGEFAKAADDGGMARLPLDITAQANARCMAATLRLHESIELRGVLLRLRNAREARVSMQWFDLAAKAILTHARRSLAQRRRRGIQPTAEHLAAACKFTQGKR